MNDDSCVLACPEWYWTVQNSRCVKESWRLVTAIVVPIVVAVIIGIVVLVCVFKKNGSGQIAKPSSLNYI